MLYIKPYGRSHTIDPNASTEKTLVRQFSKRTDGNDDNSVLTLKEKPEFIIATWISIIDKIITKPNGKNFPTPEQKIYRRLLGEACWKLLSADPRLKPLDKLFQLKLEPYYALKNSQKDSIDKVWRPTKDKSGKWREPPDFKGRHFANYFSADNKMDCAAFAAAAKEIKTYIEANRLEAVLQTIKKNTHHYRDKPGQTAINSGQPGKALLLPEISVPDWNSYNDKGDIAQKIRQAFDKNTKNKNYIPSYGNAKATRSSDGKSTDTTSTAAIIRQHYDLCFGSAKISVSKKNNPQLFQIHEAVKRFYKQLFDIAASSSRRKAAIANRMPKDKDALFNLITATRQNRDYSYLNRLGKVIYYETVGTGEFGKIPDTAKIKDSRYWTSQGQAEIKRNEALVRVWRLVTIQANHSLCLWGDHARGKEVFDDKGRENFMQKMFPQNLNFFASLADHGNFINGAKRFYGDSEFARIFPTAPDKQKELMEWVIMSWTHLRNNGFHFKGREAFLQVIRDVTVKQNIQSQDTKIQDLVKKFWQQAIIKHGERVKETLVAIRAESYLTQERLNHLYGLIYQKQSVDFPLPRLKRVLNRAENARLVYRFKDLLETKINHENLLADEGLNCRYQILGLVYRRCFAAWLAQNSDRNRLIQWIQKAVKRADIQALKINIHKDEFTEFVRSKASFILGELQKKEILTIDKFLSELSSETASSFAVQKNVYGHDSEQAQDQSIFIDNLKCDVIGQAFLKFLDSKNLAYLLHDPVWQKHDEKEISTVETLSAPVVNDQIEPWQCALYFLLHLVPVGAVSELLHQLRKWDILVSKGEAAGSEVEQKAADELFGQLARVMELYLDMHDVNFSGSEKIEGLKGLKVFFAKPESFTALYSNNSANDIVPARGLREFMRFGGVDLLQNHQVVTKITDQEIAQYHEINSDIASIQHVMDTIHDYWESEKHPHAVPISVYKKLMKSRSEYQKLASRLRLTDHLRLHSLLMRVLARLADYAGLWERDQIFVLLALTELGGKTSLDQFLEPNGVGKFKKGQIVDALKDFLKDSTIVNDAEAKWIRSQFQSHFGDNQKYQKAKSYRNDFMHLNMLREAQKFNFSDWVNGARQMMAYDRKLKNVITLSLIELFKREGLEIKFTNRTADQHKFDTVLFGSHQIKHLGGKGGEEDKHSLHFVTAVRNLFNMAEPEPKD